MNKRIALELLKLSPVPLIVEDMGWHLRREYNLNVTNEAIQASVDELIADGLVSVEVLQGKNFYKPL